MAYTNEGTDMKTLITGLLVAASLMAGPTAAQAATFQDRDEFVAKYIVKHSETPKGVDGFGIAGAKTIHVSDGFAHEPTLQREALVAFIAKHGYPKPPPPPPEPEASTSTAVASSGGVPLCDWSCILCESGGNPMAYNAAGYWGLYQFDFQTWVAHGGDPAAYGNAPASEQHRVAANIAYDAWPNC